MRPIQRLILLALLALAAPVNAQTLAPVLTTKEGRFPFRVVLDGMSVVSQHSELKEALERATFEKAKNPGVQVEIITAQVIEVTTRVVGGSSEPKDTVYIPVPDSIPFPVVDTLMVGPDSLRVVAAPDSIEVGDAVTIALEWRHPITGQWRRDGEFELTYVLAPVDSVYIRPGGEVEVVHADGDRTKYQGVHVKVEGGSEPPEETPLLSAGPARVGRPAIGARWLRDGARRPTALARR